MNKKLFLLILSLMCIVCLFSCKTTEQHFNAGYKKDPVKMVKLTRDKLPCIETGRDTLIVNTKDTVYDLIESQCPDQEYITNEGKTVVLPGKTIFTPAPTVTVNRYIEVKVKDSAEVWLWQNNFEVATNMHKADTSRLNKVITSQDKKIARKNKTLLWLWGIVIAVGLLTIFKIYRKITLR